MDTCVMCGEYAGEGNQVCWKCKAKQSKCNVCKNKDKKICLICEHWSERGKRMSDIESIVQDIIEEGDM